MNKPTIINFQGTECDEPVLGIVHFFVGIGTSIGKKLVPEKNLGTDIGKTCYRKKYGIRYNGYCIGIGKSWHRKNSWNRYQKNSVPKKYQNLYHKYLVPEKSIGKGIV